MADFFSLVDDLFFYILMFVPISSLVRFMGISSLWRCMITDPRFISANMKHNQAQPYLLYSSVSDPSTFSLCDPKSFAFAPRNMLCFDACMEFESSFQLIGTCNGLMCVIKGSGQFADDTIALWNPCIRRELVLPYCNIVRPPPTNNATYQNIYGFGYDAISDDYKVVRIVHSYVYTGSKQEPEVELYSLKEKAWRPINVTQTIPIHQRMYVLHNGVAYWSNIENIQSPNDCRYSIESFDFTSETFANIPIPESIATSIEAEITLLKGSLCILSSYPGQAAELICDVWRMNNQDGIQSWSKIYTFQLSDLPWEDFSGPAKVVTCLDDGRILFELNYGRLISYHPETKEIVYNPEDNSSSSSTTYPERFVKFDGLYTKSLVLINDEDAVNLDVNIWFPGDERP